MRSVPVGSIRPTTPCGQRIMPSIRSDGSAARRNVAAACVFLAAPEESGFMTGQNLVLDGGMTVKMIYV